MAINGDEMNVLNPVARTILQGLYDSQSPFHLLLGMHYILKTIWSDIVTYWKSCIKLSDDSNLSETKMGLSSHYVRS
jgi:hypothetical protein